MQTIKGKTIIVSPHCDDSILSLGGTILRELFEEVEVIDIFATSAWASDQSFYSSHNALTIANRAEEMDVMKKIGIKLTMHSFPEALLRGYRKWNTVYRHASDRQLQSDVLSAIRDDILRANTLFFPLANGNHVDHILVYRLLIDLHQELKEKGITVYIYEDVPYSWWIDPAARIDYVKKAFGLRPITINIDAVLDEKEKVLRMYKSQINEDEIRRTREYAASIVPGQHSERIWLVVS